MYEIGRPALPAREQAIFDAKLDDSIASFVEARILFVGDDIAEGISLVRQDELTSWPFEP